MTKIRKSVGLTSFSTFHDPLGMLEAGKISFQRFSSNNNPGKMPEKQEPMTAPLTIHNIEIHTATVEIQTLTISGKQMTLAVFRQLNQQDLVRMAGDKLEGLPWGKVNYCPGDCVYHFHPITGDHWHIIWQDGSELFRSAIPIDPWGKFDPETRKHEKPFSFKIWAEIDQLPQLFIAI